MRKNGLGTILNIIGMSISLMVFLVLFSQVWYDYRFNRNIDGHRNIYILEEKVDYGSNQVNYDISTLRPLIEKYKTCSPQVEAACDYEDVITKNIEHSLVREQDGERRRYSIKKATTDSAFPEMFGLNLVLGSLNEYNEKNCALLSVSHAVTIFGENNPIGETLMLDPFGIEIKIVGVYEDLPENCTIINGVLVNEGDDDLTLPNYNPHTGFFRLKKGADVEDVVEDFKKAYKELLPDDQLVDIRLTPIATAHFNNDSTSGAKPYASRTQTFILLSIALLFLVIAVFNHMNFSMASMPFEINSVNIAKVFGADRKTLIFKRLSRDLAACLISFLLALGMMEIVAGSQLAAFSSCPLAIRDNLPAILIGLAVAVIAAVAGGIMPALYSTSIAPGIVLKGAFAISTGGNVFRKTSLMIQYIFTGIFLTCGIMISSQTDFLLKHDNGFDSKNIIHMRYDLYTKWQSSFDELKTLPEVVDITCGHLPMDTYGGSSNKMMSKDNEPVWYNTRTAYWNYFDFFGFELIEGRFPHESEFGTAIINETFARTYPDYIIGKRITGGPLDGDYEIIGIVKDFNARPLMHESGPYIYYIEDCNYGDIFFKPHTDDIAGNLREIENILESRFDSSTAEMISMEATFLDQDIENMYRKAIGQAKLVRSSALLCLIIAMIGVLGLVYFETRATKKEIAIRKVNGATTGQMIRKFALRYFLISTTGFLIAVPVSIAVIKIWLTNFAYHAEITIWAFALSYLIIQTATTAVSIACSRSAASANPTETLKTE